MFGKRNSFASSGIHIALTTPGAAVAASRKIANRLIEGLTAQLVMLKLSKNGATKCHKRAVIEVNSYEQKS